MKKTNKGFSLVELIIVIAIMAILAGALAPALIKYINKSRISADIQTGNTIASAIQTAMTKEAAFDQTPTTTYGEFEATLRAASLTTLKAELDSILGTNKMAGKAKKDVSGGALNGNFYVAINPTTNLVEVYYGSASKAAGYMVYPQVGSKLTY